MKRGDFVTVALSGDFGKPRPALVIRSDLFGEAETATVILVSGTLIDAPLIRMTVEPDTLNGLRKTSQLMIDKIMTVRKDRVGDVFGRLSANDMVAVNRLVAVYLGIA